MKTEQTAQKPEEKKETALAKTEPSQSERFTQMVMKQFTDTAGDLALTGPMKRLCQNYFIRIDQTLKDLEKKRMATAEQYRGKLPFKWENVNLQKLAVDVVSYSSVGLDPTQPNHINCIPYKNTSTNKFDIGFIIGFKGLEIKVKKYGFDIPDDIVVELVYKNDEFKQIKKDLHSKVEGYTFKVVDDFDRGELVGGFYYHKYFSNPERNKIRVFSKADIEKRKPDTASVEFWGGQKDEYKDEWKDGKKTSKKTGNKVKVEGWYDEMAYKTIYRAAYNAITIDSQKIDDHYMSVMEKERELKDAQVMLEIHENANQGEAIGFEENKQEGIDAAPAENYDQTQQQEAEEQEVVNEGAGNEVQGTIKGPGF